MNTDIGNVFPHTIQVSSRPPKRSERKSPQTVPPANRKAVPVITMNVEAPAVWRKLKPLAHDNLKAAQTLYLTMSAGAAVANTPEMAALQNETKRLLTSIRRSDIWLRRLLSQSSQIAAFDKGFIPQVFEVVSDLLRRKPKDTQVLANSDGLSKKDCLSLLKFCLFFLPDLRFATELGAKSRIEEAAKEGGTL
jgi:hypothetical protein